MTSFRSQQGSLLIVSIWALVLMAMFAGATGFSVRQKMNVVRSLERREILRLTAEAGVKRALHALVQDAAEGKVFHALNDLWSSNEGEFKDITVGHEGLFSVIGQRGTAVSGYGKERIKDYYGAVDEESKINLNRTNSLQTIARLFEAAAELSRTEASAVAASILDWRDSDDFPNDGGAESYYYKSRTPPYVPKNSNFSTLTELLLVKGIHREIYDRILPYVTLHSSGAININTAPYAVLWALGFSEVLAKKVLFVRQGSDGLAGTLDDIVFKTTGEVVDKVNAVSTLSGQEMESLSDFVSSGVLQVNSENFAIRSVATLRAQPESQWVVRCVADPSGVVKDWQEDMESA